MAVNLSIQAENEIKKGVFEPQVVIDIKGYPLFCSGSDLKIDERLKGIYSPDFYPKVDLEKSQRKISQQLALDKGGSSSTAIFKCRLVDENEIFTSLFSFVTNNQEILEREARVYYGFKGGEYPKDFVPFLNGSVGQIQAGPGFVEISINHPDKNRKQSIFIPKATSLNGAIDATQTTITVDDASEFYEPSTDFRTFIKIEDELIEYTGISGNDFTGCIRGSLTTIASTADDDAEVTSFYEISGNSLDLARRLLLSGSGDTDTTTVFAINDDGTNFIQNAVFFDVYDIREILGASTGDIIDLTSVSLPANDFTNRVILDFGQIDGRSYYIVDGPNLTTETTPNATSVMRSQFDVFPEGCALKMHQIDQARFEEIETLFTSRFLDFRFYIKDEIDADKYINEKIYLPSSFYHLPRLGKNSVGVFAPPLTSLDTVRVDSSAVNKNSIGKISPKRGVGRHFYNYVTFRIDEDPIEDLFQVRRTLFSQDSINRIPAKNKGILIESGGLRKNTQTLQTIAQNSDRIIERYRFAAIEIACEVLYSVGVRIEIGDPVVFGDEFLQVSDDSRGDRKFRPRIMQVINKSIDFFTGRTSLLLLDTSYSIFSRFGVISIASKVLSINNNIIETTPFCPSITDTEIETWTPFIGTRVLLRLPDFSYTEELTLQTIENGKLRFFETPTLPSFPVNNGQEGAFNKDYFLTDLIIETVNYPQNGDLTDQQLWKDTYIYFNPRLTITNVIDESNFEVSATDAQAIIEKAYIIVHSPDFSSESQEVTVNSVLSNKVTTNVPLNYLPSIGDEVDLVGFTDGGFPYRWF